MELSLIYSYYECPQMLQRQLQEWKTYPHWMWEYMDVYITDDCSMKHPLLINELSAGDIPVNIYRILKKVPWNWLACRNIGAFHSQSKWLLLTDMDHVLLKQDMIRLMSQFTERLINGSSTYVLPRRNSEGEEIKSHGNSYLMTRQMYWCIGGYNEQYSGNYHGTSGLFRRQIKQQGIEIKQLDDVALTRFTNDQIEDAECRLSKTGQAVWRKEVKTMTFPYKKAWEYLDDMVLKIVEQKCL